MAVNRRQVATIGLSSPAERLCIATIGLRCRAPVPPTPPAPTTGGGGGMPAWRRKALEDDCKVLVPLDPVKMAAETFAQTTAERIAAAIARLSREDKDKDDDDN